MTNIHNPGHMTLSIYLTIIVILTLRRDCDEQDLSGEMKTEPPPRWRC